MLAGPPPRSNPHSLPFLPRSFAQEASAIISHAARHPARASPSRSPPLSLRGPPSTSESPSLLLVPPTAPGQRSPAVSLGLLKVLQDAKSHQASSKGGSRQHSNTMFNLPSM